MMRAKKRPDDETLLRLVEMLSIAQIARAFEVKPKTVRNWLWEARRSLKSSASASNSGSNQAESPLFERLAALYGDDA